MSKTNIIDKMNETPLVFDGAMGTVIYEKANPFTKNILMQELTLFSQIHSVLISLSSKNSDSETKFTISITQALNLPLKQHVKTLTFSAAWVPV